MKTELEMKLKKALDLNLKQIKEAIIDGILVKDIQILNVEFVQPKIISPSDISKDDYKNAEEIRFEKGLIRVSKNDSIGILECMYYFDGTATVSFLNNDFLVNVIYIMFYTN